MLNLSLLTSDMWAVVIRIFAYHEKVRLLTLNVTSHFITKSIVLSHLTVVLLNVYRSTGYTFWHLLLSLSGLLFIQCTYSTLYWEAF